MERDGLALQSIEPEEQTISLVLTAVRQNPAAIQYVNPQLAVYPKLAYYALQQDGRLIKHLSPLWTDYQEDRFQLILLALKQTGQAWLNLETAYQQALPDLLLTTALETSPELVQRPDFNDDWLLVAPYCHYQTVKLVLSLGGLAYRYLLSDYPQLTELAVSRNGLNLKYVPHVNRPLAKLALLNQPAALAYVPRDLLDEELLQLAVTTEPEILRIKLGSFKWSLLSPNLLVTLVKACPALLKDLSQLTNPQLISLIKELTVEHWLLVQTIPTDWVILIVASLAKLERFYFLANLAKLPALTPLVKRNLISVKEAQLLVPTEDWLVVEQVTIKHHFRLSAKAQTLVDVVCLFW